MEDACRTVACITCKRCDCELWDHVKEKLLPPIIDGLYDTTCNVPLLGAVVSAIKSITQRGSSDQIDELVEMGGLKFLFYACSIEDENLLSFCLVAIENILKAGEAKAKADEFKDFKEEDFEFLFELFSKFEDEDEYEVENEYAKMIDGYSLGWDTLLLNDMTHTEPIVSEAEGLVKKYRPHLLGYRPYLVAY